MASTIDNYIQASYGPWRLGASLNIDNKEVDSRLDIHDWEVVRSFQAPQIIGWVPELLSQLPRKADGLNCDLTAMPSISFGLRAKLISRDASTRQWR